MIIGASTFQLPAYIEAHKQGIHTIAISNIETDEAKKIASKSYNLSTLDKEKILEVAKIEGINGVMTIASEIATPTVSYIAEKLNLPGYSSMAVNTISNKYKLREYLKENNFSHINFGIARTLDEANSIFQSLNKPVIIKPTTASGSRGVFKLYKESELKKYFQTSIDSSFLDKSVIIEEFMNGTEVGGEVLINNGEIVFLQVTKKYVTSTFVPYGHILPCDINKKTRIAIKDLLQNIIASIGLKNGPLNFDIMVDEDVPKIIELGARLGGNCLPILMRKHTNINTIESVIKLALGETLDNLSNCDAIPMAAYILHSNKKGILNNNVKESILSSDLNKYVDKVHISKSIGDEIESFTKGSNQIGYVILKADSQSEIIKKFDEFHSKSWIEIN